MKKGDGSAPPSTVVDEALDATVLDASSDASPVLARGAALGRYSVLELLGRGGMGVVYAAQDAELDRKVALKLLRGGAGPRDSPSSGRLRLLREAQAMARLSHPNVIHVYDVGTIDDQVFIAMELVDGVTLRRWREQQSRGPSESVGVFAQAARGLAAAHSAGLVHRDFKPDNVLLGNDGRARVLDFGLARADEERDSPTANSASRASPLSTPLTRTGAFLGTPAYMAPEQLAGTTADARSDQFSFCVALYEALYGERPFAGDSADELLANIRAGRVRGAPPKRRVPARLRKILLRGLSAVPSQRHTSMEELAAALEHDPARARRRWVAAAGVTALLATGIGLASWRSRAPMCRGADARLAGVWDAARKQTVKDAFLATGKPYAGAAWANVEHSLDAYAHAWIAARNDACEATQVRGEQSAQALDLRTDCYDRRLREVDALVARLGAADSESVEHAADVLESLPRVDVCADVAALGATQPPPRDAATRKKAAEVDAAVDDANALHATGHYPLALEHAQRAAAAARSLDYSPLLARALFTLGRAENMVEHEAAARDAFLNAAWAAEAGRDDEVKAQAWSWLCYLSPEEPRIAHQYARNAEAALKRFGGSASLEARLEFDESTVFRVEKNLPRALELAERSLALYRRTDGERSMHYAQGVLNRGTILTDLGRLDDARADYQRSFEITRELLGHDHPRTAVALLYIGNSYFAHRDLPHAIESYAETAAIQEKSLGPDHPEFAIVLNNLGNALWEAHRYAEALPRHRAALAIREKVYGADSVKLVDPLAGVGGELVELGRPSEGLPLLERSLALGEKYRLVAEDLADARWSLARALWRTGGDRSRARKLAIAAREAMRSAGAKEEEGAVTAWLAHPR